MTKKDDLPRLDIDEVIDKFGGIRPLATRLDLTASTVQGWKKREKIPENRISEILRVAKEDGIDLTGEKPEKPVLDLEEEAKARQKAEEEAAKKAAEEYDGPERRKGPRDDRRSGYDRRYHVRMRQARWAFVERIALTSSLVFILITLTAVFLMAPEYSDIKQRAAKVENLETQLAEMDARIEKLRTKRATLGFDVNRQIDSVNPRARSMMDPQELKARLARLEKSLENLPTPQTDGELTELRATVQGIQGELAGINTYIEKSAQTVREAGVTRNEVLAAAMLMALNQFRDSVGRNAPFAQDIAVMRNMVKDDPELVAALDKLTPYAESGVMDKDTLKREFKGLAGDIAQAKFTGEDLSVKERAMARLNNLVSVRKTGDVEGDDTDAIVARAQYKLDHGDVEGALAELEKLQGEPKKVAEPWIKDARGRVLADNVMGKLSGTILSKIAQFVGMGGGGSTIIGNGFGGFGSLGNLGALGNLDPSDISIERLQQMLRDSIRRAFPNAGAGFDGGGPAFPAQ